MKNIILFSGNSIILFSILGFISLFLLLFISNDSKANDFPKINNSDPALQISVSVVLSDYNGYGVSSPSSSDGFINITVSGGTAPYTFLWSTGDFSEDVFNLCGGIYGVYIVDAVGANFSTTIELISPDQHIIQLPIDWSLFSTFIDPTLPSITDVLVPILSNLIFVKDGYGNAYWPQYGLNMIGNITIGNGYQIKCNAPCELVVIGSIVQPENQIINIPYAWSILGYIRTDPAPIVDMLSSIVNDIEIVKSYLGMIYWPGMNLDMIGNMIPGEGYQIKMYNSQSFSYTANDIISNVVTCPSNLTDFDGNVYSVVQIGNQCWMSENLKVTHYSDGTSMIDGTGVGNVSGDYSTKYFFDYNDNSSNTNVYGKLYSWAAMLDGMVCGSFNPEERKGVCPDGWHIPDNADWNELSGVIDSQYGVGSLEWNLTGDLGSDVGSNLKDASSSFWNTSISTSTNNSGFSALPSGYRLSTGTYLYLGTEGYFWSSQANCSFYGWYRKLSYNKSTIHKNFMNKGAAFSVRCLKD